MTCLDDAMVLGLIEGRVAQATLAGVDEHIDSCASCREVVTTVAGARRAGRILARGDAVGRFVIGDVIGSGAMGRVYSAWEPELDRRVAIKMLIEDGGAARDRLVREAQAMARLNHPNVVTVHEVGTTDAGVYVAMELIEGETLRAWTDPPRPWRDVVRVLVDLLGGLAAVHAAGVVHRDLKPDNMIIGSDGRVRLGDFGLARSGAVPTTTGLAVGTDTTVAGTPAYMAPEVLRGGTATAASDQFSFGVMAYELLAGRRPYSGSTWAELVASVERGDVATIASAPAWLDTAIKRCLALDPAKRFASMREVAAHLTRHASRQRPTRWIAAGLAAAAVASGATFAATRDDASHAQTCAIAVPDVRSAYAFLDERVLASLEGWLGTWKQERIDTCREASRGATSRTAGRERCLEDQHAEVLAVLAYLQRPASGVAIDVLSALPPSIDCRSATLDAATPIPLEPDQAAAVRDVAAQLPTLRAFIAVGDARNALASTERTVQRAHASLHAPTLADALLVHADALRGADRLDDANTAAREAVAQAVRGRADTTLARAWLTRIAIAGDRRDLTTADDFGVLAVASVERAGSPPHLTATLARLRGLIAYNRGKLDDGHALLEAARTQFIEVSGPRSVEVATTLSALGSVARAAGKLDDAERWHRDALAIDRELRGEQHRDVARDHHNIAGVLRLRGDLPTALETYRKALAIEIATQGEGSIAAGLTHNSIGLVLLEQRDFAAALAEFTQARELLTAADHGDRGFAEHNLGLLAQAQGNHREALPRFTAAAAIYATTIGAAAAATTRLPADRAVSEAALAKRPSRPVAAALPPAPVNPPRTRDVGVYGSGQTW